MGIVWEIATEEEANKEVEEVGEVEEVDEAEEAEEDGGGWRRVEEYDK